MRQAEVNNMLDPRDQKIAQTVHDLEDWLVEKVNEKSPMVDKLEALKVLELSEIRQTLLGIEISLEELRQDYLMNIEFKNE
jgi:hypothetical protein